MENPVPEPVPRYSRSPRWSSTTKLVVAITFVAIFGGLLLRFRSIVGPLIISFVLAYLLYPTADFLRAKARFSWRISVTFVYLLVAALVIAVLTLGGLALVDQVQSLINFLGTQVRDQLPELVESLTSRPVALWGYTLLDLSTLNLEDLTSQILGTVQPILTRAGTVVGAIATGAITFVGWTLFSILVSYFILADSGGIQGRLIKINIPGYMEDIERMGYELSRIWNAFLRGQLILMLMTILVYIIVLGTLGVNFFIGLALLAGLARFVPYVGPAAAWTTYFIVAIFQDGNIFGLAPFPYAMLVVGIALVIDVAFDNYVTPRMMGTTLAVHPAAVMVAALISANLFGVIGMVMAAPVLATLRLGGSYALRKMFDLDPWTSLDVASETEPPPKVPARRPLSPVFAGVNRSAKRLALAVQTWRRRVKSSEDDQASKPSPD